jgi:uncharacterized protein (DUF302 family)
MNHYGISREVPYDFDAAVEKVTANLKAEGFGILSTIDVQTKMKEKLGKDMEKYLILGACHPSSAYEALQVEDEIGLLMPCNVIVYEKGGKTFVSAFRPSVAMAFIKNLKLKCVMEEVEPKLEKVIQNI